MALANVVSQEKTVADPSGLYQSASDLWKRCRAVIGGERLAKDHDSILDNFSFSNLLLPFSPTMTQQQYDFYKSEAELPGIVSQYAKILVGGLLRKSPTLKLPDGTPPEVYDWINNEFTQDGAPLVSFLYDSLWEEVQTSRCWIYVDYPVIENAADLTREEMIQVKPYPVLWKAESVINWRASKRSDGTQSLNQIIVRDYEEIPDPLNEFHPKIVDTVWVHEIVDGYYQIRIFQLNAPESVIVAANGEIIQNYTKDKPKGSFSLVSTNDNIVMNGERMTEIPVWPLNGSTEIVDPILLAFVDREVALYNKISRRNHLLYGASTYTPYLKTNMDDSSFERIVSAGLGSWLKLNMQDDIGVLEAPSGALADMDRAISAGMEEMARLGIRMLTPESNQSGVALQLRNAAQTAQLGTLNTKASNTMSSVIAFMINWRYGTMLTASDVQFQMSSDFAAGPLGADFVRLMTEFYEKGLIPRTEWLKILKANDMVEPTYDDTQGQQEISEDSLVFTPAENVAYQQEVQSMAQQGT